MTQRGEQYVHLQKAYRRKRGGEEEAREFAYEKTHVSRHVTRYTARMKGEDRCARGDCEIMKTLLLVRGTDLEKL